MRADRLDIDHCHMSIRRAILTPHPRYGRQLQHGCSLSRAKVREQDDPPVRKLDGIVVHCRVLGIHLTETGEPSARLPFLKQTEEAKKRLTPLDVVFKCEFGARQEADRDRRRIGRCEATGVRASKGCCYQIVAGFGCSGQD